MHSEAPIKIVSRWEFEHMDLNDYPFAISIREADEIETPRPDYNGERLNLAFYDLTEGPGIATADDIRAVQGFTSKWMPALHSEPKGGLVIHCFAGVSRSSAIALVPLLVYYQFKVLKHEFAAAKRLFEVNRWADPNTHVVYLIEESFRLSGELFTALEDAKSDLCKIIY
jgi:predicted protein tyrosine phosphatase